MNNVSIQQDDANHQIKVSYDGATQTIDTWKFPIQKYDIDLGGGNDTLNFQLTSAALTQGKIFAVNLGAGSDTANFDLGGKSDAVASTVNRTIQASLNLDIQGGVDAGRTH